MATFKFTLFLSVASSGVLPNFVAGNISLGSCSLSCGSEDNGISDPTPLRMLRGLPGVSGKRGAAGPRGNPGIQGVPGPTGSPGISCDCSYQKQFREEMEILKTSIEELKSLTGWFQASNDLYYKVFKNKLNYNNAQAVCENLGGRLASTGWRDAQVKSKLMQVFPVQDTWIWVGIDDYVRTGTYVWSDDVVASSKNTDWNAGQPNLSHEHCGSLNKPTEKIYDVNCDQKHPFICEKNN